MNYRRISVGLELGSAAVEARLTEIALLMRKSFPECYWKRQGCMDDDRKNEMHVIINGREEPLCFTDRELISYSAKKRRTAIDHRMREVLVKLLDT